MPDAATHILIQIIFNNIIWIRKIFPYTLFGAIAPDLLKGLDRFLPPEYCWLFYPTHSPIFMLIFFYSISILFHKNERVYLISGCFIGMLIHLLIDILQINVGGGNYMPFFPISFHTVAFGLFETEASIFWIPYITVLTILVYYLRNSFTKKEFS